MKIVKIGALVTVSNHPTAQVYIVTSTFSEGKKIKATLVYVSDNGKLCSGGIVDASILEIPTIEQLTK